MDNNNTNFLYKTKNYIDNKKNIAFFYLKSFSKKEGVNDQEKNILSVISKKFSKDYNIILVTKTYKTVSKKLKYSVENICETYGFAGYYVFDNYSDVKKYSSFYDMLHSNDFINLKFNYEKIILNKYFLGLSIFERTNKYNHLFDKDNTKIKFILFANITKNIVALIREINDLKHKIDYIEYIVDPLELIIPKHFNEIIDVEKFNSQTFYFGYNHKELEMTREDLFFDMQDLSENKENFMVFGYTYYELPKDRIKDKRKYDILYYEYLKEVFKDKKSVICFKSYNFQDYMKEDEYNKNIAKSLYTIIIPSYDINHFSIFRLVDSVKRKCLPIITSDCVIDMFTEEQQNTLRKLTTHKFRIREKVDEIEKYNLREDLLKELEKNFFLTVN